MRRTKIICTLGPASVKPDILKKMIKAGMNIARLNLSHDTYAEHAKRIKAIRSLSPEVAILADLQGPRIRTGLLREKKVELKTGASVIVTDKNIAGDENLISLSPPGIIPALKIGELILLADGMIILRVTQKKNGRAECQIVRGGTLGEHKGVNLPHTKLPFPALTTKDKRDIHWLIGQEVDFIGLSFVRRAADVLALKKILKNHKKDVQVIAKIERAEAVKDLNAILTVADGVMVARGDLGIELNLEKVPLVQKEIIEKAGAYGKPVIVATQMLESMVKQPSPTRAEVSDVANAIFGGTDAVTLSEETSVGDFPVEVVKTMVKIAEDAEKNLEFSAGASRMERGVDNAVANSACLLAEAIGAKAIITFTQTGSTALRVSKHRPKVQIFGVVTNDRILRRLALFFGVRPQKIGSFCYIDEMFVKAEKGLLTSGRLKKGDLVVITAGVPVNVLGTTNLIKAHRIGDRLTL